jgi:hypothetical protein
MLEMFATTVQAELWYTPTLTKAGNLNVTFLTPDDIILTDSRVHSRKLLMMGKEDARIM